MHAMGLQSNAPLKHTNHPTFQHPQPLTHIPHSPAIHSSRSRPFPNPSAHRPDQHTDGGQVGRNQCGSCATACGSRRCLAAGMTASHDDNIKISGATGGGGGRLPGWRRRATGGAALEALSGVREASLERLDRGKR